MGSKAERSELSEAAGRLIGAKCWSVIAGPGTGSAVHLKLGNQIPRIRPLQNPNLSELDRTHDAELAIFIECAWTLERSRLTICDSNDDNQLDGPMVAGLRLLKNETVGNAVIAWPQADLVLKFGRGLTLSVVPSKTDADDVNEGYSIFVPHKTVALDGNGRVVVEARLAQ